MPLLPAGHAPLKVLHLSDIHMTPDQRAKQEWLRGLADLEPDLVDQHRRQPRPRATRSPSSPTRSAALLDVPGRLRPRLQRLLRAGPAQPAALPAARHRQAPHVSGRQLPWPRPAGALRRRRLDRPDQRLRVADRRRHVLRVRRRRRPAPELRRPRARRRPGRPPTPTSGSASTHAPYLRVLDQFAADGYDAIIAGHTHGGQVCLPGGRRADHQLRHRARPGPRAAPAPCRLRARATRARRGCTSRPGSAPTPSSASGSRAAPRPP